MAKGVTPSKRTWYGIWGGKVQIRAFSRKDVLFVAREAGYTEEETVVRAGFYIYNSKVPGDAARILAGWHEVIEQPWKDIIVRYKNEEGDKNVRTNITSISDRRSPGSPGRY